MVRIYLVSIHYIELYTCNLYTVVYRCFTLGMTYSVYSKRVFSHSEYSPYVTSLLLKCTYMLILPWWMSAQISDKKNNDCIEIDKRMSKTVIKSTTHRLLLLRRYNHMMFLFLFNTSTYLSTEINYKSCQLNCS